jgi:hypothetical protein
MANEEKMPLIPEQVRRSTKSALFDLPAYMRELSIQFLRGVGQRLEAVRAAWGGETGLESRNCRERDDRTRGHVEAGFATAWHSGEPTGDRAGRPRQRVYQYVKLHVKFHVNLLVNGG